MHINFASKKSFEFSISSLRDMKFTKLVMAAVALSMLLLMILYGAVQKVRLGSFIREKERLENEIARAREKTLSMGETIINSGGKTEIIGEYENRIKWPELLNSVSAKLPRRIWLSSVSGASMTGKVHLSGEGPDQASVAELISVLQNSGTFAYVGILSSSTAVIKDGSEEGRRGIKFEIEGTVK